MTPTSFKQSNGYLSRPPEMTDEECGPLAICHAMDPFNNPLVISCWKLTAEELEEFNRTGRIWLLITGQTMPPVALTATTPFNEG